MNPNNNEQDPQMPPVQTPMQSPAQNPTPASASEPVSQFKESPVQSTLRNGNTALSFFAMFSSFANIIKNLFSKK